MARYSSSDVNQQGQYPTSAWSQFGLPEQNYGTGAPGGSPTSSAEDAGHSNEPGQYPERETFTGVTLGGTGAAGSSGVTSSGGGPDSVQVSRPTFYKGEHEPGGMTEGAITFTTSGTVAGKGDWTQANDQGYQASTQMVGVAGNTPAGGDTQFQTGAGSVMYGGRLNGTEHTSRHPSWSGPGT